MSNIDTKIINNNKTSNNETNNLLEGVFEALEDIKNNNVMTLEELKEEITNWK